MKGTKLFNACGIPVQVHWTAFILMGFILISAKGYFFQITGSNTTAFLISVVMLVAMLGCLFLHELSHCLVAMRCGVNTKSITLIGIGMVAHMEATDLIEKRASNELKIAVAGPIASFVLAGIFYVILNFVFLGISSKNVGVIMVSNLRWINFIWGCFNILPMYPTDGGRILRSVLAMTTKDLIKATKIACHVGIYFVPVMIIGFTLIFGYVNPFLVAIGIYLMLRNRSELKQIKDLE